MVEVSTTNPSRRPFGRVGPAYVERYGIVFPDDPEHRGVAFPTLLKLHFLDPNRI